MITPAQIAESEDVSVWLVRRALKEFFPSHDWCAYWRLSDEQHEYILGQIRMAKAIRPNQPRRAMNRETPLLPFL